MQMPISMRQRNQPRQQPATSLRFKKSCLQNEDHGAVELLNLSQCQEDILTDAVSHVINDDSCLSSPQKWGLSAPRGAVYHIQDRTSAACLALQGQGPTLNFAPMPVRRAIWEITTGCHSANLARDVIARTTAPRSNAVCQL